MNILTIIVTIAIIIIILKVIKKIAFKIISITGILILATYILSQIQG